MDSLCSFSLTEMLILLFAVLLSSGPSSAQRCASRDYGNGGTVCVCNSTYCDTIRRPRPVPRPQLLIYTSNQAGLRFELSNSTFKNVNSSNNVIFINSSVKFQTILGWGGAFTDATGININSVPRNLRDAILRSYFSEDGIEYNVGRVPIGGSDFSLRPYTYDDGPPDPQLKNFRLQPEDFNYKIPYIKQALNITNNTLLLVASAWAAPRWMKTNNRYAGFGFIRQPFYETWAKYYVKFLDSYQNENITFWGITTGNEPADVLNPFDRLEVVGWPSWTLGLWIMNNFGPTIRQSNHSDIKIMVLDDQRIFLPWYVERTLRDPKARHYIDGIAVHWYLDSSSPPELLTRTHFAFPEKFILATEASVMPQGFEPAVILGSWSRGEQYSVDIIEDMLNWVTGWIDWNMVLNLRGGPNYINNFVDACIIVNSTAGEFYKQTMYYHFGHFSKFVPRGSVRIHSQIRSEPHLYGVAFRRPDNGTSLVLLNRNEEPLSVNITDSTRGTASIELSPRSISTVLYW